MRARDKLAAGTICTGNTYGGGWVQVLFTRRPWRKKGVATALLRESFRRFWERGEHSIGSALTRRTQQARSAYTRAPGFAPTLGLVIYEKQVGSS